MSNSDYCEFCGEYLSGMWPAEEYKGNRYHAMCLEQEKNIESGTPAKEVIAVLPVCPYCGYREDEMDDGLFGIAVSESIEKYECENCGKEYNLSGYVEFSFTSTPMEADEND